MSNSPANIGNHSCTQAAVTEASSLPPDSEVNNQVLQQTAALLRRLYSHESLGTLARDVSRVIKDWGFSDFAFFIIGYERVLLSGEENRKIIPVNLFKDDTKRLDNYHFWFLRHFLSMQNADQATGLIDKFVLTLRTECNVQYLALNDLKPGYVCSPTDANVELKISPFFLTQFANILQSVLSEKFQDVIKAKSVRNATSLNINKKPLQVIKTMASKDLPIIEVARNLNVCPDTVNNHIAAAKKSLSKNNVASVVYQLAMAGLV